MSQSEVDVRVPIDVSRLRVTALSSAQQNEYAAALGTSFPQMPDLEMNMVHYIHDHFPGSPIEVYGLIGSEPSPVYSAVTVRKIHALCRSGSSGIEETEIALFGALHTSKEYRGRYQPPTAANLLTISLLKLGQGTATKLITELDANLGVRGTMLVSNIPVKLYEELGYTFALNSSNTYTEWRPDTLPGQALMFDDVSDCSVYAIGSGDLDSVTQAMRQHIRREFEGLAIEEGHTMIAPLPTAGGLMRNYYGGPNNPLSDRKVIGYNLHRNDNAGIEDDTFILFQRMSPEHHDDGSSTQSVRILSSHNLTESRLALALDTFRAEGMGKEWSQTWSLHGDTPSLPTSWFGRYHATQRTLGDGNMPFGSKLSGSQEGFTIYGLGDWYMS